MWFREARPILVLLALGVLVRRGGVVISLGFRRFLDHFSVL